MCSRRKHPPELDRKLGAIVYSSQRECLEPPGLECVGVLSGIVQWWKGGVLLTLMVQKWAKTLTSNVLMILHKRMTS